MFVSAGMFVARIEGYSSKNRISSRRTETKVKKAKERIALTIADTSSKTIRAMVLSMESPSISSFNTGLTILGLVDDGFPMNRKDSLLKRFLRRMEFIVGSWELS